MKKQAYNKGSRGSHEITFKYNASQRKLYFQQRPFHECYYISTFKKKIHFKKRLPYNERIAFKLLSCFF